MWDCFDSYLPFFSILTTFDNVSCKYIINRQAYYTIMVKDIVLLGKV